MSDVMKKAPMGWNSWDCWGAAVTEETVRKNAEFMAKNLKEFGWEYVVVDIQWSGANAQNNEYIPFQKLCMDEYGRLIPAVNRFPSAAEGKGFKPLADYVHSLGLKFGIHIMRGIPRQAAHENLPILGSNMRAGDIADASNVCAWNPDMYGINPSKAGAKEYYDSIFKLYAQWDVDFIKLDDICREMPRLKDELILISESLKNCGRDMVFSISPGPAVLEYSEFYKSVANMWRITDDFWDKWELLYAMFERAEKWSIHTGAGNWPDADMLPVGPIRQVYGKENRTNFSKDEQITMLTLWSIFRSPLMIGGDMPGFDDFTVKLLTNREILKMHENARHSHQVYRRKNEDSEEIVWAAADKNGGTYFAVFNAGEKDKDIKVSFEDLELDSKPQKLTELWSGEEIKADKEICCNIPAHGAKAFLLH